MTNPPSDYHQDTSDYDEPLHDSTYLHYCGGYGCDNPAPIEVLAGHSGGTLGWLCEDCADEVERKWERDATKNKSRIEARGGFDV